VSNDLATEIAPLDAALKTLSIGVPVWHAFHHSSDEYGNYWERFVGYAKVGTKWGLACSVMQGHSSSGADENEEWLFNDAPRWLRLEAFDHIPELLERMVSTVDETTQCIESKIEVAKTYADLVAPLLGPAKK